MSFKIKKPKYYKNYNEDWETPRQIIVTDNGIYKKQRVNSICYIVRKVTRKDVDLDLNTIVYDKIGDKPLKLEDRPYMLKKIPHKLMETILRFYKVYARKNTEVKLNVWYDKINDKFILDCPFQKVTSGTVREFAVDLNEIEWTDEFIAKYPEKYDFKKRIVTKSGKRELELVLDTHSHHNMTCSFSLADDKEDYYRAGGRALFGVYKNVGKNPTLDLRYFLVKEKRARVETRNRIKDDEVRFAATHIIDYSSDFDEKYDFNLFAKHINPPESVFDITGQDSGWGTITQEDIEADKKAFEEILND